MKMTVTANHISSISSLPKIVLALVSYELTDSAARSNYTHTHTRVANEHMDGRSECEQIDTPRGEDGLDIFLGLHLESYESPLDFRRHESTKALSLPLPLSRLWLLSGCSSQASPEPKVATRPTIRGASPTCGGSSSPSSSSLNLIDRSIDRLIQFAPVSLGQNSHPSPPTT